MVTLPAETKNDPGRSNVEPGRGQPVTVLPLKVMEGSADPALEQGYLKAVSESLGKNGFEARSLETTRAADGLAESRRLGARFMVDGYYHSRPGSPGIEIYLQVYDPDTGYIIDAHRVANEFAVAGDIELDQQEIEGDHQKNIEQLAERLSFSLQANKAKKARPANIRNNLSLWPLAARHDFPVQKDDTGTEEAFRAIREESVTIVSRRIDKGEKVELTSAIVSLVTRDEITASGARNLSDILKVIPGIEVFYDQYGFFKIAVRGLRSRSGVLLLLDGHRMNNFYDGSIFYDLRADIIDRVELIRGPGSSVYGANAFTAVINVITRRNRDRKDFLEVNLQKGSFETFEGSLFYSRQFDRLKAGVLAHYFQTDGQSRQVNYDRTCNPQAYNNDTCLLTYVPLKDNSVYRTNNEKEQVNLFLTAEHEGHRLSFKALAESRGPNFGPLTTLAPGSRTEFQHYIADAVFNYKPGNLFSMSSSVYGDLYGRDENIQVLRQDNAAYPGRSMRQLVGYNYYTAGNENIMQYRLFKGNSIMLGLGFEYQAVDNFDIRQNFRGSSQTTILNSYKNYDDLPTTQNRDRLLLNTFLQDIWEFEAALVPGRFNLTAGVRLDSYSDFGESINPKGGLVYIPFDHRRFGRLSLKALYGRAFRAPTFQELYDQTQKFQEVGVFGNNTLKPETISNLEGAVQYRSPWQPLELSANVFRSEISNNIVGVNTSGTFPRADDNYDNFRGIDIRGFETETRVRLSLDHYVFVNYSWFEAVDHGGYAGVNEGRDVDTYRLDVPQWRINAGYMSSLLPYVDVYNALWVSSERSANYRFVFETQANRRFSIEEYAVYNISLVTKKDLLKNTTLQVQVFNVFDTPVYDDYNIAEDSFGENRRFRKEGRYFEATLRYIY